VQRRAKTYATSLALVIALSAALTACGGSSGGGSGGDAKPGSTSATGEPAPPGKYRTLPEPCGAVSLGTLKSALPGAKKAESGGVTPGGGGTGPDPSASPYEGKPSLTYDTDRRVGCHWRSSTRLATRHLSVDLERVVSYDPSVSDDQEAQQLYEDRAEQADIPDSAGSSDGGDVSKDKGKGEDQGGSQGQDQKKDQSKDESKVQGKVESKVQGKSKDAPRGGSSSGGGEKTDSAGASSKAPKQPDSGTPSPDSDLSPRTLDGIGDNAYIDDKLDTAAAGVHRDITLVFRSANVIATVKYDQWLTDKRRMPDSAQLQQMARNVARELAGDLDEG
jgi:hypothetical protein